ncbi:radical SAM protein [Bacillus sp. DX1.1]|uniref:radical SAM protein n=1 Tax=unclassified Bacillus (in: firmicutes) TaxID=185979 RepID=UPI00257126E0|nr:MULTISPECIES: radical SAM protein [unclassified Bacillus (in: firmicutes)]MDM5153475.1 radical SAM protein [Bacillus sp. DX1.1]WJE82430.1 radical SAM protein [Bacillus sp. DX3.1]
MPNRDYLYYDLTSSVCSKCLRKVEAKIIIQNEKVYLIKHCMLHGREKVLISTDIAYYKQCREFIKPSEMPYRWNTPIKYGCPYDCGLCPDHEQHSCLSIIEITDACNLQCPICYAESSPKRTTWRTVEHVEMMLDAVVKNEKNPDVVQISGGEPTLHPHFFDILTIAKQKPIKHIMINTNGLRIAQDITFVEKLAKYTPGFEIYLQFDSFEKEALQELRGADLREIRRKAIEKLNEYNISTTLVVTLKKGVNDKEIGEILQYAVQQRCVRGVTFQPIQQAGRTEDYDPETNRLTLSEVRQMIIEQSSLFTDDDIIPVPCHPDSLAMGYALKLNGSIFPLTSIIDRNILLEGDRNTIVFENDDQLKGQIFKLFSLNHSPQSGYDSLKELLCCLPKVSFPTGIGYENVFRVLIMKFMDNYDLDIRSVKKSCVHIVHPDGRIIPFDTYNLFYRDEKEEYLKELQDERVIIK